VPGIGINHASLYGIGPKDDGARRGVGNFYLPGLPSTSSIACQNGPGILDVKYHIPSCCRPPLAISAPVLRSHVTAIPSRSVLGFKPYHKKRFVCAAPRDRGCPTFHCS